MTTTQRQFGTFVDYDGDPCPFRESAEARYKPKSNLELFWVDQIAFAEWRLNWIATWEADILRTAAIEAIETSAQDNVTLVDYLADIEPKQKFSRKNSATERLLKNLRKRMALAKRAKLFAGDALAKLRNEPEKSVQSIDPETTSAPENKPDPRHRRDSALK